MNFVIFASFIIFGFWLTYELKKHRDLNRKAEQDFWERELQANNVRRKPLDDLPYVTFPFEALPSDESFNGEIPESLSVLRRLASEKMVNLGGISNTELKLTYGTANLTILSEYDQNYETFAKNIYQLCKVLYDAGRKEEAEYLLEEAIPTGTDLILHYRLLAQIYRENGEEAKIADLKESASQLHSLTRHAILRDLSADCQYND